MTDDYFIRLKNASEFERSLLESSQEAINIIELQKKITTIRDEKQETFAILEENLKDIKKLLSHLEMTIPRTEMPKQKIKTIKSEKLDDIEKELGDIDKEMESLKKGKKK
jgi:hypothetical protein